MFFSVKPLAVLVIHFHDLSVPSILAQAGRRVPALRSPQTIRPTAVDWCQDARAALSVSKHLWWSYSQDPGSLSSSFHLFHLSGLRQRQTCKEALVNTPADLRLATVSGRARPCDLTGEHLGDNLDGCFLSRVEDRAHLFNLNVFFSSHSYDFH